jgi:hypothetical protein
MSKPLTNKDIDDYLILNNRPIQRIGNYINADFKIKWKCLNENCDRFWDTRPKIIKEGKGCPDCGEKQRIKSMSLNSNDIDQWLLINNPTIIRIGEYVNSKEKIEFRCLECDERWITKPDCIKELKGCPPCGYKRRALGNTLSNKDIDEWLEINNPEIIRIDNYINAYTPIYFGHEKCGTFWKTTPNSIRSNLEYCPACNIINKNKFNNDNFDLWLKENEPEIIRIDDYITSATPINFWHLTCDRSFKARPATIKQGSSCPTCSLWASEKLAGEILTQLNINYELHYRLDLKLPRNNVKKRSAQIVDFFIPSMNLFIEYNGEQHYRPVCFGGMDISDAEAQFQYQIIRDEALRKYCKDNNINLLEIDGRIYNATRRNNSLKDLLLWLFGPKK